LIKKKAPPVKVEPIGRNLSVAGFEGGGTVARWDGSGLREEEQPDPGVDESNREEEELRCIDR